MPERENKMIFDDDAPPKRPQRLVPLLLDRLSVVDLEDYITELRAEIVRAEADIERKQSHRNAAESFFRKPT